MMLGEADFTDATKHFGIGWDYDYAWGFQEGVLWKSIGSGSDVGNLKIACDMLLNDNRYSNLDRMTYLTNHDVNYNHNAKLSNMYGDNKYPFTVLIFTLFGMPLIYNGQEIGGEQILNYFSDSKINWNNYDSKMYNTIRTCSAMKHTINAFRDGKNKSERGSVIWVKSDNNVIAYIRKNDNSEALVILNLGERTQFTLNGITGGTYTQWLDSQTIANGPSQKKVQLNSSYIFKIDKKGYAVYVLDR
jgi:glycosidase